MARRRGSARNLIERLARIERARRDAVARVERLVAIEARLLIRLARRGATLTDIARGIAPTVGVDRDLASLRSLARALKQRRHRGRGKLTTRPKGPVALPAPRG